MGPDTRRFTKSDTKHIHHITYSDAMNAGKTKWQKINEIQVVTNEILIFYGGVKIPMSHTVKCNDKKRESKQQPALRVFIEKEHFQQRLILFSLHKLYDQTLGQWGFAVTFDP